MIPSMRRHPHQSGWAMGLAVAATGTALCMSVLAGWQRGGWLTERVVWVAIGVVLVIGAHLLPALIRDAPIPVRATGSLLWVACLVTACYGHAVFFVLAQEHAGERRASTVTVTGIAEPGRNLTVVMSERANVTARLAAVDAKRCTGDCRTLGSRRVTLAAKLDALNAEADDVRRDEVARDRVTVLRDALRADPVTSRLAALLGMTTTHVDLLSGLTFSAVLEGVACLLWTIALRSSPLPASATAVTPPEVALQSETVTNLTRVTQPAVTVISAVTPCHVSKTVRHEGVTDDDVTQLARDVTAGIVRPTVSDIRRHLGCSQSRAAALRRQLASPPA